MNDIKRVVAIVEPGAERQPALERVKYLSGHMEFELKLIACDYSQYLVEGYYFSEAELPGLRKEYLEERRELLEVLAQPLREAGMTVTTEAIWSHPRYQAIVDVVESFQPDLVVHHAKKHAALSRAILTNDDWQLARHCTAPLLVVKEKPWKNHPVILAAVDPMHGRHKPSGLDHRILDTSKSLADKTGGDVYAAHAYGQFPLSGVYPADAEKQHQEAFRELTQEYGLEDTHALLIDEAPEYAMKKLEEDLDADLVVVGAISRSIVTDVLIGSVTEKVLDFLECDALLLRPEN